jgi:hypothetical protein
MAFFPIRLTVAGEFSLIKSCFAPKADRRASALNVWSSESVNVKDCDNVSIRTGSGAVCKTRSLTAAPTRDTLILAYNEAADVRSLIACAVRLDRRLHFELKSIKKSRYICRSGTNRRYV